MAHAFVLIMAVMVFVNVLVYVCMHPILWFLRVPQEVMEGMRQSVMNFGILMVQGLVNSFGATTMAAFAAAVKIDTFAYLPVQDFGNAYSTFVAQNYGVKDYGRIQKGTKEAFAISIVFSIIISILVCTFAASLMEIFVKAQETAVIACGVQYLRIEGSFYCGIGCLFLLYGRNAFVSGKKTVLPSAAVRQFGLLVRSLSAVPQPDPRADAMHPFTETYFYDRTAFLRCRNR